MKQSESVVTAVLRERIEYAPHNDARFSAERALREAGYSGHRYNIDTTYLARGRNMAAREFLEDGYDWLWFIDSDVVVSRNAGVRLLARGKKVVSGLYFQKKAPYFPEAYQYRDGKYHPIVRKIAFNLRDKGVSSLPGVIDPPQVLIEIHGVGAGCLLIHREVLEKLGEDPFGPTESGVGEDLWFCSNAREAGFQIYLDWSVLCGHLTLRPVGASEFLGVISDGNTKTVREAELSGRP